VARPTLDDVFLRATGRRLEGDGGESLEDGGGGRRSGEGGSA